MVHILLLSLSFLVLFGFMAFCIVRYGLKDCFSRYSYRWETAPQALNWWSLDLIASALMLMPIMLDLSVGSKWQFLGFLAPISMLLVGFTPRWATNNAQYIVHNVGVVLATLFSIAYAVIIPKTVWLILILGALAGIATLIYKKAFIFWLEIAMYGAIYGILLNKLIN